MDREIILIAHNIRSTHNVGAIFRTADGLGIRKLYLTGYTPYPKMSGDTRLPHIAEKLHKQIHKTALGAEESASWEYVSDPSDVIEQLKVQGIEIVALEQNSRSVSLPVFTPAKVSAILLGEEVNGISSELLKLVDKIVEIPMQGKKESYNVSIAAAIALYHFRFTP